MRSVELSQKRIDDYRGILPEGSLEALKEAAEPLRGKRVLHVNSTAFGGGVAELLHSIVPLMRDLGLDARWSVIEADQGFFRITKTLHNGLQGGDVLISDDMYENYREVNRRNAEDLADEWDFVVIHDPQPAALIDHVERSGIWLWRCHIDLSAPNPDSLAVLARLLPSYDACVYTMKEYAPKGIDPGRLAKAPTVIHPSIDPLTSKNRPMAPEEVEDIVRRYGVDPEKPTISSVARFDPWKDPLGIIDLYRVVKGEMMLDASKKILRILDLFGTMKRHVPNLQLLLAASMAHDDPEGWEYYERTLRKAGEDPDIFFLTNLRGVGSPEVNAFQRTSDVSLLMSIREGFGLSVAESLWKRVPVVGSRVGGIPLQVIDGVTGYLASDSAEAVPHIIRLLRDEDLRKEMGAAGQGHIRRNFLVTRHVRDYLDTFNRLSEVAERAS